MLQYLKKNGWKYNKTDLKSSIQMSVWIFFLPAAPTAQNSPELNIHFIDSCIQWSLVLYFGCEIIGCKKSSRTKFPLHWFVVEWCAWKLEESYNFEKIISWKCGSIIIVVRIKRFYKVFGHIVIKQDISCMSIVDTTNTWHNTPFTLPLTFHITPIYFSSIYILLQVIRDININIDFFIPHRIEYRQTYFSYFLPSNLKRNIYLFILMIDLWKLSLFGRFLGLWKCFISQGQLQE